MKQFTVGSLFSGIGGIDLGLERTGRYTIAWQIELDDSCQRVLAKHWPDTPRFRDVRDCGAHNLTPVDLLAGGWPCQPHSLAGRRRASADERDLWGEFYRIIRALEPTWVLAENVPGLLSSEDGRFFGRILRDLAQSGYDAEWQVLSAASVGAPHLRERVFLLAYTHSDRRGQWKNQSQSQPQCSQTPNPGAHGPQGPLADPSSSGMESERVPAERPSALADTHRGGQGRGTPDVPDAQHGGRERRDTPGQGADATVSRRTDVSDPGVMRLPGSGQQGGLPGPSAIFERGSDPWPAWSDWWTVEPGVGRVADGVPHRVDRLRALGNAVVPQVAEYVGRCLAAWIDAQEEELACHE